MIDECLYQAEIQVRKEEARNAALKYDDADTVALLGQPAHKLVELFEQALIYQVDWSVVDRHRGDSTLNANVKGLKIRKAH